MTTYEVSLAGVALWVLTDVSLDVRAGELVTVTAASGAGKTTLLNVLAGLERPRTGRVAVAGHDLGAVSERRRLELRRTTIGYMVQTLGLIPMLSAAENIGVPLRLARATAADRDRRVAALLDRVGLTEHANQRPDELSGGQQQRVAFARALATDPRVLLADEPTGQLDAGLSVRLAELLRDEIRRRGTTAVITTYDPALLAVADRQLVLVGGRIREDPGRAT